MALIFANVAPARLDRGNCSRINRIDVRFGQIEEHFTVEWLIVELLCLDAVKDFTAKVVDLLDELWPKVVHRDVRQVLQLAFIC